MIAEFIKDESVSVKLTSLTNLIDRLNSCTTGSRLIKGCLNYCGFKNNTIISRTEVIQLVKDVTISGRSRKTLKKQKL